jgi:RNA polymerase sigma-70 factor (ECF subfamily)
LRPSITIAGRSTADVLAALASEDIDVARQALADIYETYFDTLWHFAYRWMRSRDRAKELVHDVFLRLWMGRTTLKLRGEVIVYLRGAVRNHVYLDARHSGVITRMETAFAGETTELPAMGKVVHPDTSLDQAEIDRVVAKALAAIAPRDRDVVTMRWIDRMTLDEIASILGVSKSRVRTILARATARLMPALDGLRTK